jgi:ERCC4-type nuclease
VIVDDRAGSRDLLDYPVLAERAVRGTLDFGDVMLSGHGPNETAITVGVEVKSVFDLLRSINNGRLGGHQIPGLLRSYDYAFLLIFGAVRPGPDNRLQVWRGRMWRTHYFGNKPMPWPFLEGFLLTAQMFTPLKVKWVYNESDAASWLCVLDHWLSKPWGKHKALAVFDRSREIAVPPGSDPVEVRMARIASCLPGIDWYRGWNMARHFDSVQEMINADTNDFRSVKSIGPVLARAATEAIRRRKDA